jgi:hypothetical protein
MPPTIERELNEVERQIGRLRVDFERFFSGELKLMPLQGRRRLENAFRQLWLVEAERAVDRFRLQTLQERYTVMTELWEKKQRVREEGLRLLHREPNPAGPKVPREAVPPHPSKAADDAEGAAPVKARPRPDFRPLFERYQAARRELGEGASKMTYERFEELVRQKAEEIRNRTGSTKLVFEIRTEDGKVRLLGRPAPGKG